MVVKKDNVLVLKKDNVAALDNCNVLILNKDNVLVLKKNNLLVLKDKVWVLKKENELGPGDRGTRVPGRYKRPGNRGTLSFTIYEISSKPIHGCSISIIQTQTPMNIATTT